MIGIPASGRGSEALGVRADGPGATSMHDVLRAAIGSSQLLAWPGDRRLHLLDPVGAVLWDLQRAGWSQEALTAVLAERFGLEPAHAGEHVLTQQRLWRRAGLLDAPQPPAAGTEWQLDRHDDRVWPAPQPRAWAAHERCVVIADRRVAVRCADPVAGRQLDRLLGTACATPASNASAVGTRVDHALALHGDAGSWRLSLDEAIVQTGTTGDAALVAVLSTLTELGCRPAERLMVVHGAGLVTASGCGLLLVAPGGSGKTTLATALDAAGYGLLSDDVVPVTLSGELLGLGLPLCLKPGSWPVLQDRRPDLVDSPPVQRLGQTVRYLRPQNPAAGAKRLAAGLLLTRYAPGEPPGCERIVPEQALRGLVEAEAVLRNVTQAKLDALADWLNRVPAYRLNYPNLDTGLRLVGELVNACGAEPW